MEKLYRLSELTTTGKSDGVLPVSPASWWRWVRSGDAPNPVRLGGNKVAWKKSDIEAWIESRSEVPYMPKIKGKLTASQTESA